MVVKVASFGEARDAVVSRVENVPFTVAWVPCKIAGSGLWLCIEDRKKGFAGGYVELRIDPMSAEIVGLSVLRNPVASTHESASDTDDLPVVSIGDLPKIAFGPKVDVSMWEPGPRRIPRRAVVQEARNLESWRLRNGIYISFSETKPKKKIPCGPVEFVVDEGCDLVGIVVMAGDGHRGRLDDRPGRCNRRAGDEQVEGA
ncbi:hypothetical protein [Amycolatopsis sp. WAC 04169]|uniref:hypothetical protein n=1 Tax=Amycolatopsis sp. WAC 04169 TaxID=2203197 RepID=UPI000F7AB5E4|nr:hypothetical protein [Amycolatopsis sp. WAC 04169]